MKTWLIIPCLWLHVVINGLCIHDRCCYILKQGLALCNIPEDFNGVDEKSLLKTDSFRFLPVTWANTVTAAASPVWTPPKHTHTQQVRISIDEEKFNHSKGFSLYCGLGKLELTMHALSGSCLCFISSSNLSSSSSCCSRSFSKLSASAALALLWQMTSGLKRDTRSEVYLKTGGIVTKEQ